MGEGAHTELSSARTTRAARGSSRAAAVHTPAATGPLRLTAVLERHGDFVAEASWGCGSGACHSEEQEWGQAVPAGGPGRHGGVRGAWERAQLTALWCAMRARLAISAWGPRLTAGQLNPCRPVLPVLRVRGPAAPPCTLACTLNPMGEQPGIGPAPAVGSGAAGLHRTRRSEAAAPCIWLNGFTSHTCGMALGAGCQQLACVVRLNLCVRVGQRLCLGWYAAA